MKTDNTEIHLTFRPKLQHTDQRINLDYTTKKLQHITSTGNQSSLPVIIKRNMTADYIHWASKVATSAYKRADKRIYKTESTSEGTRPGQEGPPKQLKKLSRP